MSTSRKQSPDKTWPWAEAEVAVELAEVADVVVVVGAAVVASSRMETSGELRVVGVKVKLGELLPEVGVEHRVTTPTKLEAPPTGAVEQVDTVEPKEATARVGTEEVQCVQQVLEQAADTEQLPTALEWVAMASKAATEEVEEDTEVECKTESNSSYSTLIYVRLRIPHKMFHV